MLFQRCPADSLKMLRQPPSEVPRPRFHRVVHGAVGVAGAHAGAILDVSAVLSKLNMGIHSDDKVPERIILVGYRCPLFHVLDVG